jgi:hypothetical protein
MWAASHHKALLKNAELVHTLRERASEFGIQVDN